VQPTVDQLLGASRRLLGEVAAEGGLGPQAAGRLELADRLLRQVARTWAEVGPFVAADADATAALLGELAGRLPEALAAAVAAEATAEVAPGRGGGGDALEARARRWRQLLAEAVPHLGADDRRRVAQHLRRRLDADPTLRRPAARPPAERPA